MEVFAHRGLSEGGPENTRGAFDAALAAGFRALELDVRRLGDGTPVVFHDATAERLAGVPPPRSRLAALDEPGLRALFPPLLTLREAADLYAGRDITVNVEVKDGVPTLCAILPELTRLAGGNRLVVSAFDPVVVEEALDRGFAAAYLFDDRERWEAWRRRLRVRRLHLSLPLVLPPGGAPPPSWAGFSVYPYVVDDHATLRRLRALPWVVGFFTDRADLLGGAEPSSPATPDGGLLDCPR